jgi:hypothetical protein
MVHSLAAVGESSALPTPADECDNHHRRGRQAPTDHWLQATQLGKNRRSLATRNGQKDRTVILGRDGMS